MLPTKLRQILRPLARLYGVVKSSGLFAIGYAWYLIRGTTPFWAYLSMRRLYCTTNGYLNDTLAGMSRVFHPPYKLAEVEGLLGRLTAEEVEKIADAIRSNGYHCINISLPPDVLQELRRFAETTPSHPMESSGSGLAPMPVLYDPDRPVSVKYEYDHKVLMTNPTVQRVVADASLMAVAQAYFGAKAFFDFVAMWWSTALLRRASAEAAQLYHFDMDRIKFLKFFFYLTDVGPDNGPHCFIAGSHRRKPWPVLRDERIEDEELQRYYPAESFVEITGPAGSIVAVDTRGFHKGKPLLRGHRLMLQLEYTTSFFGQNYGRLEVPEKSVGPELHQTLGRFASAYRNIVAR